MLKPFYTHPLHGKPEFALHLATLRFIEPTAEIAFKKHYFTSNLAVGRACHLIAIVLYGSIGLWDGLIIEPDRLNAWLVSIGVVSLIFSFGLLLSYRKPLFFAASWQPLYAFYVVATGAGVTFAAVATSQHLPLFNFVGIIFCLFFCYTIIRLPFVWAAPAGNLIILIYAVGISRLTEMTGSMISTSLVYMAGVSILGMIVNYTQELMSRRDFILNELLKQAEVTAKQLNSNLEAKVSERTAALRDANLRLRESLEALQRAEAIAGLGYFEQNWQTGNGFWSAGLCTVLGFAPAPAGSGSWEAILENIHEDDRVHLTAQFEEARRHGKHLDFQCRAKKPDGTLIDLHGYADTIHDDNGQPLLSRGIIQDISEQKATRDALKTTEAQLIQAQKLESIGRLAGGVAHDFNNVTGIIIGYSELAMAQLADHHPLYQNFQEILKAATRATAITRQLLAFARKQTISPEVLALNETMAHMLKMLQRLIGENIELTWHPGDGLWPVRIDASQVDQILANLCINARDAIAGSGKLLIETRNCSIDDAYHQDHTYAMPGDYVMLAVSDNGSGIAPEHLDNIFEPFFTTKQLGEGTGLGLATVYGIVKQNSGFINVYSEPGTGTTIKIYLPRFYGETTPAISAEPTDELPFGKGETVLVVEDDPAIRTLTQTLLAQQAYHVVTATCPDEAISIATSAVQQPFDLLITDVIMPAMNGRVLADRLLGLNSGLSVLYMSGYTANVIAHHGVLDEGVHFIHKPFTRKELVQKVRQVLDCKR